MNDELDPKGTDPFEYAYRSGDPMALFNALRICASKGVLVPKWASDALQEGLTRYESGEAREFGEAFGIERPKGWQRASDPVANWPRFNALFYRINNLRAMGHATNDALFKKVGAELYMSGSKTSKLFYASLNSFLDYYLPREIIAGTFAPGLDESDFLTALTQRANELLLSSAKNCGVENPAGELVSYAFLENSKRYLYHMYLDPPAFLQRLRSYYPLDENDNRVRFFKSFEKK